MSYVYYELVIIYEKVIFIVELPFKTLEVMFIRIFYIVTDLMFFRKLYLS